MHWTKAWHKQKVNDTLIRLKWREMMLGVSSVNPPCVVRLERLYGHPMKEMDGDDNLRMAFKGIKDTIADLLVPGLAPGRADDPKHGITWQYAQTSAKTSGIRIYIVKKDAQC